MLAGPGSGKTRTLCQRARFLLGEDEEGSTLLLTFANRAAAEMKQRALEATAVRSDRLWAGTYHSFGAQILRDHGGLVGVPTDFEILDQDEAREFAQGAGAAEGLGDWFDAWQKVRLHGVPASERIARFGAVYEEAKRAEGLVDFDDLIVYPVQIFRAQPGIPHGYALRYPHVLIDEFQDTNGLQLEIVLTLSGKAKTVSVFADDDQAILSFVGARSEHVHALIADLNAREYPLMTNYRCREVIAGAANRLMAADPRTSGRRMQPGRSGGEVRVWSFGDEYQEAKAIVADILAAIGDGVSASDIAVLSRTGARLTALRDELHRQGVDAVDWSGERYGSECRRFAKACLALVRGRLSSRQAVRLCELLEVHDPGNRSSRDFLAALPGSPARDALEECVTKAVAGSRSSDVVRAVQNVAEALRPDLVEGLGRLVIDLSAAEDRDSDRSLDHLLSDLALGSASLAPPEEGGIKIATLHKTKGLEWRRVFLVGMEDDHLPHYLSQGAQEVSEERRVCFVGVCRAEEQVTLSWCEERRGWSKQPSRFLAEMGVTPPA